MGQFPPRIASRSRDPYHRDIFQRCKSGSPYARAMSTKTLKILQKAAAELYPLITKKLSDQSTKKYNNDEWTLSEIDSWKNISLPQVLKERYETDGDVYVTKNELVLLMDWKLAKGKFRPALQKLIKSNTEDAVLNASKEGYNSFMTYLKRADLKDWSEIQIEEYKLNVRASLKIFCQLKGVGPATASLLLSSLCEATRFAPPFFSDESFMYFIQDALRPLQPIKYTVKEYVEEFVPVLINVAAKEGISPNLLEKGSWSLKTYQIYKIDRLADVRLPFDIGSAAIEVFDGSDHGSSNKRLGTYENKTRAKKRKLPSS